MPSSRTTLSFFLLATTTTTTTLTSAASITFQNASPNQICYTAELSSGTFPSTTTTPCGGGGSSSSTGISIPPGQTTRVPLPSTFNGALTAWTHDNTVRGARYEINFAATTTTWYDADYQLGMSDGTVGPLDGQPLSNWQASSLAGEADTLAKANAAWPDTSAADKAALLAYPEYLKQGADGQLDYVYCDADAPRVVIDFFQVTAGFDAYIDAGSVAGVSPSAADAQAVRMADAKSLEVGTQDMLIVAH